MSSNRTLLVIAGTRPEIIKQAPLKWAAENRPDWRSIFALSGQHRELGEQTANDLGITPDHNLDLMRPGQSPSDFLGLALPALSRLIAETQPTWVAVQGDTTTALAGALAGFYARVPVLHVEAGLRTHNLALPFPEEGHRQLITRVSNAHAAPTRAAFDMLTSEAVPNDRILQSGNTGIDCLLRTVAKMREQSTPPAGLPAAAVDWSGKDRPALVLVTLHRRESFGSTLEGMCRALARAANDFPEVIFTLPVHPNPAVGQVIHAALGKHPNVYLLPALPYTTCVWLMERCSFIVTDSGGLQEEGPALGKPVLVLRDVTERPEAVACGSAALLGCEEAAIYATLYRFLAEPESWREMAVPRFPYGDGQAAVRILDWLARFSP